MPKARVGDNVTFRVDKKIIGTGEVLTIEYGDLNGDEIAIIFRQGKTYRRPLKDVIKSYKPGRN